MALPRALLRTCSSTLRAVPRPVARGRRPNFPHPSSCPATSCRRSSNLARDAKAPSASPSVAAAASSHPHPHPHPQSSVDPSEVSHFAALASSWWDPHGSSRLLHLMNPLRHEFIRDCLASAPTSPTPPLRYLDVGCGGGIFAESAARLRTTASVTAIDPTAEVLAIAEAHKRRDPALLTPGRLTYLHTALEDLPREEKEGYDVVTCFEVLEHVGAPAPFLRDLMAHVRPGGWLVLSTISRTWTAWLTTIVAAEELVGLVPRGTHDWDKYIHERELRDWFARQAGWEGARARTLGVMYIPGFGWKKVAGSEGWGNYFFGIQRRK